MKNSISIMKYIFCIIGLIIWVQAFYIYKEKQTFLEKLSTVPGIVVDEVETNSPTISFVTKDGTQIQFTPDSNNNPLNYSPGEKVEVLYDPNNPKTAKLNAFFFLYLGILVVGIMGAIFVLVSFSFFRSDYLKRKKKHFLQQNGKRIVTRFKGLQLNMHVTVNSSHPYFICSKWLDSINNKTYVFKSEDIWLDPKDIVIPQEIEVLIDPLNPEEYYMDISFLSVKN
ncbi:DUF3592 domain-containing protein [Flavobacterium sp. GN10]|uniref:DUF3592 domain-containing protein n=1 Tax=Flavobacterium tagetis TaxID=2801336 RepID=A0ABS1KFU8_9FLAO|nr:DUF3592 domain-containing protein [Flavobacterium tagetis]MBL0738359.1 DUF3592 domain-containing protein [Flavobacterium tagetis]